MSSPGKMMVAAGAALYGCGCFVQPGQQPQAPPAAELAQVTLEQPQTTASSFEEAPQSSSNWEGIAAGVALGLIVGLAGGASPAKAAGGPGYTGMFLDKNDVCRIRDGCTGEKLQAWAKRNFAKEEKLSAYTQDKKYSTPSTGCGVYKRYGLDFASPMKGNNMGKPGEGYNGDYIVKFVKSPWGGQFKESNEQLESQAEAVKQSFPLGKSGFTWQKAPYKWDKSMWEK